MRQCCSKETVFVDKTALLTGTWIRQRYWKRTALLNGDSLRTWVRHRCLKRQSTWIRPLFLDLGYMDKTALFGSGPPGQFPFLANPSQTFPPIKETCSLKEWKPSVFSPLLSLVWASCELLPRNLETPWLRLVRGIGGGGRWAGMGVGGGGGALGQGLANHRSLQNSHYKSFSSLGPICSAFTRIIL